MAKPIDVKSFDADEPDNVPWEPISGPIHLWGRDTETASIESTIAAVARGSAGAALLLSGDSGAGKTALADWAIRQASILGYSVARATCEPFHAGMSFFPIQELSRKLAGGQPVETLVAAAYGLESNEAVVARRAFLDDTEPATRREYMMATFANVVFGKVRSGAPVLIFVDDLERIDAASVDALTVLMSRLNEGRVLLLGAFRSDLVAADKKHNLRPLLERTRRGQADQTTLAVEPISERFTRQLLEGFLGGPCNVADSFLQRLHRETEGNPLYIREVVRSLRTKVLPNGQFALSLERGEWKFDRSAELWDLPQSIEDAIATRLTPLSDLQREVVDAASVIGRTFRYQTLLELLKQNEDELLEHLEILTKLELIHEIAGSEDFLEFAHGKIREVLYGQITGLRRTRLHAQVAEVLESQRDLFSTEEWDVLIGLHLFDARKYDSAAPHLLDAGRRALRVLAAQEAASRLRRCLEALEKSNSPDPRKLSDVRLLLGEALKLVGDLDGALRELSVVAKSDDSPEAQRWALNHLGDIFKMRDQIAQAEDCYQRCEQAAQNAADGELLCETAADLAELHMRESERLAGRDAALARQHADLYLHYLNLETELAQASESRGARARSLRNQAKYERTNGTAENAIPLYERSLEFMDEGVSSHQF